MCVIYSERLGAPLQRPNPPDPKCIKASPHRSIVFFFVLFFLPFNLSRVTDCGLGRPRHGRAPLGGCWLRRSALPSTVDRRGSRSSAFLRPAEARLPPPGLERATPL